MHGHYTSDYTCYLEYWELPDGTLKISACQGDMMSYWTVKIPSKIDGKRVSTIESGVFTMVKTQIIIEIEEGITTIQEGAFDSPYRNADTATPDCGQEATT